MTTCEFMTQSNWFAVQTKQYRESQAASNIKRLGLEVLLPQMKREKMEYGNRKTTVKPLFPGYLFARFRPSSHLHSIQYARGVNRVVCAGQLPLPVGDEVVSVIQSRVDQDGYLVRPSLHKGDEVVVNDGPLQGLIGVFEQELPDGERIVILLKAVEYQARVLIDKLQVSPRGESD
jgi:transcriptional antiterminator RfaH